MILSVIIPSFNGEGLLQKSLPLLIESIKTAAIQNFEIIVINNGPEDGSKSLLKKYPNTIYHTYPEPLGFAKASNIGLKKAQGDYILLLNNDCLLKNNTIKNLFSFLQENEEIYFTQPVIKESGKNTVGYRVDLEIAKAFPVGKNVHQRIFLRQENPFNKGCLFGLSATCLMLRKEAIDSIGYFDESFGSYLEDVDFMFRAVKKDIKFAPCISTKVNHLHMQTSQKMGIYKARHDFVNWIRIINKHYPRPYLIKHFSNLFIERARNLWGIWKIAK